MLAKIITILVLVLLVLGGLALLFGGAFGGGSQEVASWAFPIKDLGENTSSDPGSDADGYDWKGGFDLGLGGEWVAKFVTDDQTHISKATADTIRQEAAEEVRALEIVNDDQKAYLIGTLNGRINEGMTKSQVEGQLARLGYDVDRAALDHQRELNVINETRQKNLTTGLQVLGVVVLFLAGGLAVAIVRGANVAAPALARVRVLTELTRLRAPKRGLLGAGRGPNWHDVTQSTLRALKGRAPISAQRFAPGRLISAPEEPGQLVGDVSDASALSAGIAAAASPNRALEVLERGASALGTTVKAVGEGAGAAAGGVTRALLEERASRKRETVEAED